MTTLDAVEPEASTGLPLDRWRARKLRYLLSVNPSVPLELREQPERVIPFIPMEALGEDGSLDAARERPVGELLTGYSYFASGDVLMAKVTPCFENGKAALVGALPSGHGFGSTELTALRAKEGLAPEYLLYLVQSDHFRQTSIASMTGAGGLKRVPDEHIRSFQISVPPEHEQREIVGFLDHETAKIDALITKQEQLIDTLREDRAATVIQAVTKGVDASVEKKESKVEWVGSVPSHWQVRQIKWGSPVKRGASPRPIDDPRYFDDEGEWSWVRIADVSSSSGRLHQTTQRLSQLGSSLSVKLNPGSLFISIAGTVGKPCITEIPACIHDGFVYFPTLDIDSDYLYRIFEAGECYKGLGKLGTQLNLNTDTIGSIYVPLPPREEQQVIVRVLKERCEKIDALIDKSTEMIDTLREYRSALITNAVTGKIDVRESV